MGSNLSPFENYEVSEENYFLIVIRIMMQMAKKQWEPIHFRSWGPVGGELSEPLVINVIIMPMFR